MCNRKPRGEGLEKLSDKLMTVRSADEIIWTQYAYEESKSESSFAHEAYTDMGNGYVRHVAQGYFSIVTGPSKPKNMRKHSKPATFMPN